MTGSLYFQQFLNDHKTCGFRLLFCGDNDVGIIIQMTLTNCSCKVPLLETFRAQISIFLFGCSAFLLQQNQTRCIFCHGFAIFSLCETSCTAQFKVAPYSFNSIYTWKKGWRTKNEVFASTLGLSFWHSQWRLRTHLGFYFRSYEYISDCCHGNKQSLR